MSSSGRHPILICTVQFEDELKSGATRLVDIAPLAKRFGVAGVEYREVYWRDKAEELPTIRAQIAELGLMATYATFTPLLSRDPAVRERLLGDVEDAHALGSPLLRVFRGDAPTGGPEDAAMIAGARAALDRAAELGITLTLENHIAHLGPRLADVQQALALLPHPALRVNLDTSNYALNGQDIVEAIRALCPAIHYAHLKDVHDTPNGPAMTYLGNGYLPLREIFAELDACASDIPYCFEFRGDGDPEGAIRASLAHLERLGVR